MRKKEWPEGVLEGKPEGVLGGFDGGGPVAVPRVSGQTLVVER